MSAVDEASTDDAVETIRSTLAGGAAQLPAMVVRRDLPFTVCGG